MNAKEIYDQLIDDIRSTKTTKHTKEFKKHIQMYNKQELTKILREIEENIYFGQHGVDDITWFKLKVLIKETLTYKK